MQLGYLAFASAFCCVGVALLWQSRRGRKHLGRLTMPAGWVAIGTGLLFWCLDVGAEFGTVYALATVSVLAWAFILIGSSVEAAKPVRPAPRSTSLADTDVRQKLVTFVIAGPLACAAAACLTLAAARLLPVTTATQMVTAALLFPVVWASLCAWYCATTKKRSAGAFVIAAGMLAAALISLGAL